MVPNMLYLISVQSVVNNLNIWFKGHVELRLLIYLKMLYDTNKCEIKKPTVTS